MLAQNFKTATDLGITDVEQQALIKVLGMLERGELVDSTEIYSRPSHPREFNMADTLNRQECGTVGCIAGWAYSVSDRAAFAPLIDADDCSSIWTPAIRDLFGIGRANPTLFKRKSRHAALALRSYLTTGDARWDLALAD